MKTTAMLWGAVACLLFAGTVLPAADDGSMPPAARLIPADALIVIELARPMDVVDLVLNPKIMAAVAAMPAYAKAAARPEAVKFFQAVKLIETNLATGWRPGLAALAGRGLTLAVTAAGNLVVIDGSDPTMLGRLNETVVNLVKLDAVGKGAPDRVSSRQVHGVAVWSFGPEEAHACIGTRFLLSNRPAMLEAALAPRGASDAPALADLPAYKEARAAAGANASGTVFVNLELLKQNPDVQQGLMRPQEPLGALLFSAATEALKGSRWLAFGIDARGSALSVRAAVDGATATPEGLAGFTWPGAAGEGMLPNLAVPRRLAAFSLYRDLARFYRAKDELFPERTSGIIFFENMMGIFFTGRNFADEVLAQTRPETRIVVAAQAYDEAVGTPAVQIPAFAAVFRLKDAAKFGIVAEEGWQKALGLINFTRGQDAQPGLLIDKPVHGGIKFTSALFAPPSDGAKEALPLRFNFSPSLACAGDYLIMSSTEGLARDLIDAVGKERAAPPAPDAGANTLLEIDGAGLGSILAANRDNLIRQNMINEGRTREEAEDAIGFLLGLVRYLDRARLTVTRAGARPEASLEVALSAE